MKRFLLNLIIFFITPCASLAEDECTPNLVGYDICKAARKLADESAKLLPMLVSQDMMLEKVFAIQNMVSLTVVLGYEKQYLESAASQGGVTMEAIEDRMRKSAAAYICQPKSSTAAFINLGGHIQYIYRFSDGSPYLSLDIKKCRAADNSPQSTWNSINARITGLSPFERRSIVLCVREQFTLNYDKTVKHNLSSDAKNQLWAWKVYSRASAQMSRLAETAGWPEMSQYFRQDALDAASRIRGEINNSQYMALAKKNESVLQAALKIEHPRLAEHRANFQKYEQLCKDASLHVVGDAKLHALQ